MVPTTVEVKSRADTGDTLSRPGIWCFTTYFAEGLPYTIIRTVSSVYFRDMRVSLESIGLTSFYSLPWILKFLWAPLVDQFGSRRGWLSVMQAVLCTLFLVAGFAAAQGTSGVSIIAFLFLVGAVAAATQDTAVDGYYMEALDSRGQSRFVGYRVMAYRIAMMTGTGVIVSLAVRFGWAWGFWLSAALMGGMALYHQFFLPRCEEHRNSALQLFTTMIKPMRLGGLVAMAGVVLSIRSFLVSPAYGRWQETVPVLSHFSFASWTAIGLLCAVTTLALMRNRLKEYVLSRPDSFYTQAFLTFIDRKHIGLFLSTIIFLRTGEFLLSAMVSPFMVDMGMKHHYGWLSGGLGLPCSIAGALVGGWLISRLSLKKVMWPFLLAQNLTNIIYMALALSFTSLITANIANQSGVSPGMWGIVSVAAVHGFDQFAGGLGTAVLMTLLMKISAGPNKTSHFAIGTGLMNVSGLFAGVASGFLASWLGYGYFFGVSFLVSLPGMVFVVLLVGKPDFRESIG
ncbi:MAG: MFS transporter [Chitinivibrionales bacterium]